MPEPASDVRNAAALSFGHAAAMVLGGVLALLIAHVFGKSAKTDAFFAAYGVYAIALVFGQTFRLTAIPRLVGTRAPDTTDRLLAAVLVMGFAAVVPMVLLADPIGELLIDGDPQGTAAESLRALWPALAGQLVIGLLAAVLVVRGAFGIIAFGYLMSGMLSIVLFLALEGALGIQAVSVALGISTACVAALFLVALSRTGWHPVGSAYRELRNAVRESGRLLLGSMSFVAANLGYVVCLAIASREGEGEATLYAYAYFTAALLVATTAVSAAMARAPKLLSASEPEELSAANSVSTYRFTLLLVLPAFALAALVGEPVLDFLLGSEFDSDDTGRLVTTLLCLAGWVLGSAAGVLAIVELLRRGRLLPLAMIAIAQLLLLPGLAIAGRELAGIAGVATGQSLAMMAATAAQLRAAFGPSWLEPVGRMLRATLVGAVAVGLAFAASFILVATLGDSAPVVVTAVLLGLALTFAASSVVWRDELRVVTSLIAAPRQAREQTASNRRPA